MHQLQYLRRLIGRVSLKIADRAQESFECGLHVKAVHGEVFPLQMILLNAGEVCQQFESTRYSCLDGTRIWRSLQVIVPVLSHLLH
jgi:hypothetical protein